MLLPFNQLPDYSRVWVYQAARKLTEQELEIVRHRLSRFCEGWNTHGNGMPTSFEVFDNQILVRFCISFRLLKIFQANPKLHLSHLLDF